MKAEDKVAISFLAIAKSEQIEISGSVSFEGEDQLLVFKEDPRAIIEIYDADNLVHPVQTQPLTISRYFQFSQLPRKNYQIKVIPKRGANDRRYEATIFQSGEQSGYQTLVVSQSSKGKANFNRTALLGPIIFALICIGLLYKQQV